MWAKHCLITFAISTEAGAIVKDKGRITSNKIQKSSGLPFPSQIHSARGPGAERFQRWGCLKEVSKLGPQGALHSAASHHGLCLLHSRTELLGCPRCSSGVHRRQTLVVSTLLYHLFQHAECKSHGGMAAST